MAGHEAKTFCMAPGCPGIVLEDGFCTICGYQWASLTSAETSWFDKYNALVDTARERTKNSLAPVLGPVAAAFMASYTSRALRNDGKEQCAECGAFLINYICPRCDTDLVRDMTTPYHPYLWEMEVEDKLIAHAMGVSL